MTYSVKIKGSAAREIRRLGSGDRASVVAAIDGLRERPHAGTLLKGQVKGLRRIRADRYRIIYEVQDEVLVVLVLRVGHRRDVYR